MGPQTGGDTCLMIEVAFADADEIIIEVLPSFSNGLMFPFLF